MKGQPAAPGVAIEWTVRAVYRDGAITDVRADVTGLPPAIASKVMAWYQPGAPWYRDMSEAFTRSRVQRSQWHARTAKVGALLTDAQHRALIRAGAGSASQGLAVLIARHIDPHRSMTVQETIAVAGTGKSECLRTYYVSHEGKALLIHHGGGQHGAITCAIRDLLRREGVIKVRSATRPPLQPAPQPHRG